MSNSPSIQEILNAVKKSGYLMEQEVASVLENDGFIVATNSAFPDTDKEISREVDILARKMVYENDTYNIKVFIELICECKNNQNPFVFISRKKNKVDFRRDPKEFYFPIKEYAIAVPDKPNTVTLVPVFSYWGLQDSHYYYRTDSKAVQFCRILRKGKEWEAGHADVYNSIFFSLVKALHARLEEVRPSELWGDDSKYVWLFFPTVVLNTALYLIDTSCDEPKPILSDHVSYVREISTSKYRGYYLLDFVTQEGLLNFVHEKVEKFSLAVADVIENNPELFLEGPSLLWNQ